MKAIIAGIYFLFDGQEIVYVGQSSDIFRRIYEHSSGRSKGKNKKFDTWEYFEINEESERLRTENLLISALKPKYNIDYSGSQSRSAIIKSELKNENAKKVNKIKWFVNEFDKISNSISVCDMDSLFDLPKGTFINLILDGTIPEEDYYCSNALIFDYRIKFDAAYKMAKSALNKNFKNNV